MNESKNVIMYFILLLGLFVLLFFTQDYYFKYTSNIEELNQKEQDLQDLDKEIKALEKNKEDLKKGEGLYLDDKKTKKIKRDYLEKYMTDFSETDFVSYIYSLGEEKGVIINGEKKSIIINNLSLDKGKKDKNGFTKGTIKIGASFPSEYSLLEFLKELLGDDAKYKFYMEKFEYPMGKTFSEKDLKINIELIIYYK